MSIAYFPSSKFLLSFILFLLDTFVPDISGILESMVHAMNMKNSRSVEKLSNFVIVFTLLFFVFFYFIVVFYAYIYIHINIIL